MVAGFCVDISEDLDRVSDVVFGMLGALVSNAGNRVVDLVVDRGRVAHTNVDGAGDIGIDMLAPITVSGTRSATYSWT